MKQLLSLVLLATLSLTTMAQDKMLQPTNNADLELQLNNRMRTDAAAHGKTALNTAYAPFYHGVASGDPLQDRVIIWTRVTDDEATSIDVTWQMATDVQMTDIVASGQMTTDATKDFTVKIDVEGLSPQTTYYYNFSALDETSLTGRTRTAATTADHLKFGIVSCSNYQSGYYNAYARLSELNDLDAIIHLGDYIYEYEEGGYGYTEGVDRGHEPTTEVISLEDYRTRYSFYKLDPDLQAVHQQHPFVNMWDDHETANDSYKDGAENHNEDLGEGTWEDRKSNGKTAFFEWQPVRDNAEQKTYRSISYGDIAEIIILDTRLEGRTKQAASITDPNFADDDRKILGDTQREWFKNKLADSDAQWKLVANQVIFSPLALESLIALTPLAEEIVVDIWEGYPASQGDVVDFIDDNNISNIAFLTGDVHATFAIDVAKDPTNPEAYDPATGEGSLAVEMVTPSITSDSYDEVLGETLAAFVESGLSNTNPQLKKANVFDHGYYVLDVTPEKLQGDWYYVETHLEPTEVINYGNGMFTNNEANFLQETTTAAPPKETQEDPAPVGIDDASEIVKSFVILANYPNPTSQMSTLNYGLSKRMNVNIALFDVKGQLISQLVEGMQEGGLYSLSFNAEKLAKGTYFYKITTDEGTISQTLVVQ